MNRKLVAEINGPFCIKSVMDIVSMVICLFFNRSRKFGKLGIRNLRKKLCDDMDLFDLENFVIHDSSSPVFEDVQAILNTGVYLQE